MFSFFFLNFNNEEMFLAASRKNKNKKFLYINQHPKRDKRTN